MQTTDQRALIAAALQELKASQAAQMRAINRLEIALEQSLQDGLQGVLESTVPVTEHRRQHRSGTPPRIDSDPELQTFILARIERLTFAQIASEVAQHFPTARRVGKSAIHHWWKMQRRRQSGNHQ